MSRSGRQENVNALLEGFVQPWNLFPTQAKSRLEWGTRQEEEIVAAYSSSRLDCLHMDSSMTAAIIAAAASVAVAVISKGRWWAKKPDATPETGGNITAQTGDVSESLVAVGTNITQHQGTVQNYYGVAPPPAGPFHGKVATRPSMVEIANAILAAKPYDRTQIPKNYTGMKVSWPVIFYSINTDFEGSWYVSFVSPDAEYWAVSTCIDIEKYPKLKVIEYGHPAWVEGRILRADVPVIQLEDGAEITLE